MTKAITIPHGVYFSKKEYANFKNGKMVVGDKISIGISCSYHPVVTITGIDNASKTYDIRTDDGGNYCIDWDIEKFNNYRKSNNFDTWAFYKVFLQTSI